MPDDIKQESQRPEMPSEAGPLGKYKGQRPPAPDWFEAAISARYTTHFVERDGGKIHYQTWGDKTKPALLLTHGNGAHAHWWDFTAPYFTDKYYIVALTLSGMGDSDWRSSYDMDTFASDQMAVAEDAGLFRQAEKPIIVAHSFGGFVSMYTGGKYSNRFNGVIIIDSPVRPPEEDFEGPPRRDRPNKVYTSLETALGRFRLAPPQPCENHYAMDYIARYSLRELDTQTGGPGWQWKFDPSIWRRFDMGDTPPSEMIKRITCPLAIMRGEESGIMLDPVWAYMQELVGPKIPFISIPHAHHHVMLDQPIAFISALRTLLASWRT